MIDRINEIKSQLGDDLLIVAHHYQGDDIVSIADVVGDSLKLAQVAEKSKKAKYIVFCGVHFMAETADILTEDYQKVIMPDTNAGCPMADMADLDQTESAWDKLTEIFGDTILPITYINSKASIKAFCGRHGGTTVTSSNADKIVKWGLSQKERILFLPDQNLGKNTAYDIGVPLENMALYDPQTKELEMNCMPQDVKVILWKGFCHVHHNMKVTDVEKIREQNPDMKIIVHPECQYELASKVDYKGSTEFIINKIQSAEPESKWAVGTELNLVNRLISNNKNKKIIPLDLNSFCVNMKLTSAINVLDVLEGILKNDFKNQVVVDKDIAKDAVKALNNMLSLS